MTRRRWIADEVSGDRAALIGSHAEHLARVLRARVGQQFDIAAGGSVRRGVVTSITENRVEFELGEELSAGAMSPISLMLAVFKFDRMEWAIEKCTELGVARVIPVIARRSDAYLVAAASKRVERWERIARQASEQSRRTAPPEISPPLKLKDAVLQAAATRVVLSESEEKLTLREALESHVAGGDVLLAIGTEGGWAEEELVLFAQSGWTPASLGNTILRAETAAIAATAIAVSDLS
jgi:16S rRNA (uracil1498-N3)-methyltransferase